MIRTRSACLLLALLLANAPLHAEPAARGIPAQTAHTAPAEEPVFATVGDEQVMGRQYLQALSMGMRQRFYHGKIPQEQLAAYRREVAEQLIDRILLLQEARRLKLEPDHAAVKQQLDQYEARYAESEMWQQNRERLLPGLRENLEQESLLQRLEQKVKNVPPPPAAGVETYYRSHPDKFTTPEQRKVSLIMLKIAPSSAAVVWDEARKEAAGIVAKLRGGANFAELARIHSSDESAQKGGDMGFLHRGMLAKVAEEALDQMQPGQISDPVNLLQGIAILRLDERLKGQLNPLHKVEQRARELLQREQTEQAWEALRQKLRRTTKVTINQELVDGKAEPAPGAAAGG